MPDRAGWLIKALYETAGELRELLANAFIDDVPFEAEPLPGQPSLLELAREARNREAIAGWQIVQIVLRQADALALHDYEWLDTGDGAEHPADLLSDYADHRRETCGLLWSLTHDEWDLGSAHPFMGRVSVTGLAEQLHQHDLDTMFRARKVIEELHAGSPPR